VPPVRIEVSPTPSAAADLAAGIISDELAFPGPTTLGLAGGSTPIPVYRRLGEARIDWGRVVLWMSDERWVPADHEDSNTAMVLRTLGEAAAPSLLIPEFSPGGAPDAAAAEYERRLDAMLEGHGGRPHTVLLGMGADGHTASLFPGSPALEERSRRYAAVRVADLDAWRLTATPVLLGRARHLVFVVLGPGKAAAVEAVLGESRRLPARLVAEMADEVTWILDETAASRL
jgi:6-phosphogluconolactonase